MADRYQKIRRALAMGPTRGPWGATHGDAYLITACDPDTIRALLEERDELAKDAARYRCLSAMATQQADSLGPIFRIDVRRSEPYLFNFDAAVDAVLKAQEADND